MKRQGKRALSLLLALVMAFGLVVNIQPAAMAEMIHGAPTGDEAVVSQILVTGITDGTGPFDNDDQPGNDSGENNTIVRTFDTVTYNFSVTMASTDSSKEYQEAHVKLEFVLPLTSEEAVFDTSAMGWIEQTAGYAPVLTTETRSIDGVATSCQVLTCYKYISDADNGAIPGSFGDNVAINVKSMKNGDKVAPIFSASLVSSTVVQTATPAAVTVSAAPKYNIRIAGTASYKDTFGFDSGNSIAQAYGDGYNKGNVTGRVVKYGIVVQLYNDNASKGFKGIELPNGSNITFDVKVSSTYTINTPNAGSDYTQGTKVDTTEVYTPLLWSCDGNTATGAGYTNRDGRVLYDTHGAAVAFAPYNSGGGSNACYNGGTWTATQEGDTIHVTVSGYQINMDSMPTTNADTTTGNTGAYGVDLGIGCFSAGELWLVQPYNKIGETSDNLGPQFDIVTDYGQGKFDMSVTAMNMKAVTVSGTTFADTEGTSSAQTRTSDDYCTTGVELTLPGGLQNRVAYADPTNYNKGVNVDNYRDGFDSAAPGTEIRLLGGFSYTHKNEQDNLLYWGTNLTKFYGSAIEITTDTAPNLIQTGGANAKEWMVYYATKPDGTDWASDWELMSTYEDSLVFYKSPADIPEGYLCVGLLFCFKEDTFSTSISEPYFFIQQPAKVRDDMDLSGNSYILASTSRAWTKSMFEQAGMTLDTIPDWTNPETKLSSFPSGYYSSANISGSIWYNKTDYSQAADGIITNHNSDWRHWGDTLLVVGYKAGITLSKAQTTEGMEKTTYDLDSGQRVADFILQPSTTVNGGTAATAMETTVTVTLTLPKYLTYRPGSSYFGGTYRQTSTNGGTQGTVIGGSQVEPTVVTNADGTSTLTWIIENVTVGAAMEPIYYSTDIGDMLNLVNDIPQGTTLLENSARIFATGDLRQPSAANGNLATVGISAVRGASTTMGKLVQADRVESNGQVDYIAYYNNNGDAETSVVLLDTMPYNGIGGSAFTGSYTVSAWKLDTAKCGEADLAVYYTTDEQYKDATTITAAGNNTVTTDVITSSWTKADMASDGTVTAMNGKQPTAWAIVGNLPGQKAIYVEMQIQLAPDYADEATQSTTTYLNTFSAGEASITASASTIKRTMTGMVWADSDQNGVKDTYETYLFSGVTITLLVQDASGAYVPYHYGNVASNPEVTIQPGQSVSVLDVTHTTHSYTAGFYRFTDLPAGTYAVRFEDGSTSIAEFTVSPVTSGENGSKATGTYSSGQLTKAEIQAIAMPQTLEDYTAVGYNCGFCSSTSFVLNYDRKVSIPTKSFQSGQATITLATSPDAATWSDSISTSDYEAAIGKDSQGNPVVILDPLKMLYSQENSVITLYYKLTYSDGSQIVTQVKARPADIVYYEESNESMFTFTDGKRGVWQDYEAYTTADADNPLGDDRYAQLLASQGQDFDTFTNDEDSHYTSLAYSGAVAKMVRIGTEEVDSNQSNTYPTVTFSFYGTGFDLISMGTPYGGVLNVQIYDSNGQLVRTRTCNTRYGVYYAQTDNEEQEPEVEERAIDRLYQGTMFSTSETGDLAYGKYTVKITAMYSSFYDEYGLGHFDLVIDGIRIINPLGSNTDELDYNKLSLHDIYSQVDADPGLFVTQFDEDHQATDVTFSELLDYYGPKFEVHLAPNQSLAFTVNATAGAELRIGAHSFTGAAVQLTVTAGSTSKPIDISSATLMHYNTGVTFTGDATTVILRNTGSAVVALTDFSYLTGTVNSIACNATTTQAAMMSLRRLLLTPEDTSPATSQALEIKSATLSLESDLAINFYVDEQTLSGWEEPYMVFTKAIYDAQGSITGYDTQTVREYTQRNGCYVYTFSGISAKEMSSAVTATLYADKDGVQSHSETVNYSVLTYAMRQLQNSTDQQLHALLVDLLNYGAAAQTYWNYNSANLANADLTAEQQALGTQEDPVMESCKSLTRNDGATVHFAQASLSLEEKVTLNYYLNLTQYSGSVKDLQLVITYKDASGQEVTQTVDGSSFAAQGGYYVANFSGLNARQMRTACTAEVLEKATGQRVSDTVSYSIASYAQSKSSDADSQLVELVRAMMKYGDSTCAYFG